MINGLMKESRKKFKKKLETNDLNKYLLYLDCK